MTSRKLMSLVVVSLPLSILPGCATAPIAPPPQVTVSAKVPVITPLPETKEAQAKGGVELAAVPASYTTAVRRRYSVTPKNAGLGTTIGASLLTAGNSDQLIYVEEAVRPFLDVIPGRLAFRIRVSNQLSRVFRGQGSVVQLNIDNKMVDFGQVDYRPFLEGIIPPRNEASFLVLGPPLTSIPDETTIGLFLFDVPTSVDEAGNIVARQNFEWYFKYSVTTAEQKAETRTSTVFMQPGEYQKALALARSRSMEEAEAATAAGR